MRRLAKPNQIGWAAAVASLTGVAIQSLLPELTRYSFLVFLAAALLWLINALLTRNRPLALMQSVLAILNGIAIARWLA